MKEYVAVNSMTFADEDVERWCESYDRGEFPEGEYTVGGVVMGYPPLSTDKTVTLTKKQKADDEVIAVAEGGIPVTGKMIQEWCTAYDKGELPDGYSLDSRPVGRPRLASSEENMTFKDRIKTGGVRANTSLTRFPGAW